MFSSVFRANLADELLRDGDEERSSTKTWILK